MKITEWMDGHVSRTPDESFCGYLIRCIAAAEQELKMQKKVPVM